MPQDELDIGELNVALKGLIEQSDNSDAFGAFKMTSKAYQLAKSVLEKTGEISPDMSKDQVEGICKHHVKKVKEADVCDEFTLA